MTSMVILAACGSEPASEVPEDRQFANDPVPTQQEATEPTAEPTVPLSDTTRREIATPATLLRTRGAPSTLYTVSDGDLLAVSVSDARVEEKEIELPEGSAILGMDASPTGDRVGVLFLPPSTSTPVVAFFSSGGVLIGGPYTIGEEAAPDASPGATPVATPLSSPGATLQEASPIASPIERSATPMASPQPGVAVTEGPRDRSVTWIPQGNGVLVVWDDTVVSVDIENGSQQVAIDGVEGTIVSGSVSPKGSEILLHVVAPEGYESAYLARPSSGDVHELQALRTDPDEALGELTWLPSGNGILYVRGERVADVLMRGQLFKYEIGQEVPSLVATSGQGGPSATITTIEVSPDGRSVAHDVSIRDRDNWFTHSLWVRSLREDASSVQVPVDNREPLTGLEWSREGLVWMQTPEGGLASMHLMARSGDVLPVAADATPNASPIASPVIATPVTVGP